MDANSSQSSFLKTLKFKPEYLKRAAPLGIAIALASAALLPMIRAGSPELVMGAAVLSGLGTDIIKDLIKGKLFQLGKKKDEEILKETEDEILKLWNAPDEKGVKFRRELSQFLRQNGILQMALNDAPDEMKGALAESFAELANEFEEFSWALKDIQKRLVEISALGRHNVEISNEILAKVNFLAKIQREHEEKSATPPAPTDDGETDDLPPTDIPCPYKGLAAFQPQDVEYFYGRETLTAQLLANLAGASFLAVVGPSGSGKSSLVRAGVIPALWNGGIPGSENWKTLIMRPGAVPLEELGVCVASESQSVASSLVEGLRKSEGALRLEVKKYLLKQPQDAKFILVVDQFEEIFTQCKDESERGKFIAALVDAAQNGDARIVVILTLRADFYGHCAPYPALAKLLSENQVLVGAMSADELRRAINLPAEKVGLAIQSGLADLILEEVQGEAGPLPMISHALVETWKLRRGRWLKVNAYRSFGGVKKAIASTADEVFATYTEAEREQVRDIFLRLTRVDENAASGEYRDASQRVLLRDLIPAGGDAAQTERLLDKLADARLIVKDMGRDSQVEVEVAHEALITHWDKLRGWLNENREALRLHQNISEAAHDWLASDRDENLLVHRGGRLEDALELHAKLNENERKYLVACEVLKNREQRRLRWTVIASITAAVIFLVLGSFGWVKSNEAIAQAGTAQANANAAATAQTISEEQAQIAIAQQLAAQAQLNFAPPASKQIISILLAAQSMKMFPSLAASQVLQESTLAHPLSNMTHGIWVNSVAFSPDDKFIVTGGCGEQNKDGNCTQGSIRVWEIATGHEITHMINDSSQVTYVAYSPNGKYVVSSSADNTTQVWEAITGREVAHTSHDNNVRSVVFSPDGKYVVSGSEDGTVRVWNAMTGQQIAQMTGGESMVVTFSSDGKYVASGEFSGIVRIWEIDTGKEISSIKHGAYVESIAFDPRGHFIVTGGDSTVQVWLITSGKKISSMNSPYNHGPYSVAFSPDGRYVVSNGCDQTDSNGDCFQGSARLWITDTGKEVARMTYNGFVLSAFFSPNGKYVVSGGCDQSVNGRCSQGSARVWDVSTGREITRMTHDRMVIDAKFSPNGRYVVSCSSDGAIRVWDVYSGSEVPQISPDVIGINFAISPNSKYIATGGAGNTYVWETATGKEISSTEEITRKKWWGDVEKVAFSPDGIFVASVAGEKTIHIWDIVAGKETAQMIHDSQIHSIAYNPDGKYVVSGSDDYTARVWEVATGKEISRMKHDDSVYSVAFSPDGKYVVSASSDGTTRIWGANTGKEVARSTHNGNDYSLAFSPNGKWVVSGGCEERDKDDLFNCIKGIVRVWEVATGKEISRKSQNGEVNSVAFSPGSNLVISGGCDQRNSLQQDLCARGVARVWDAVTGREVSIVVYEGTVRSVSFSPDGKWAVSGGCEQDKGPDRSNDYSFCTLSSVRIWEIATGKELIRMAEKDVPYHVTFSPNGKYLVMQIGVTTIHVAKYLPEDIIINACSRVTRNLTRAEWDQYIGDALPYQAVCPNLPIEAESTPTP